MVERVRLCACFSSTDSSASHNPCHELLGSCRYSDDAFRCSPYLAAAIVFQASVQRQGKGWPWEFQLWSYGPPRETFSSTRGLRRHWRPVFRQPCLGSSQEARRTSHLLEKW